VPALARPTHNLTVPVSVGGLSPSLSLANADGARRPARSAGYPWLFRAEPVPPGRLHSSTGLPHLISQPRFLETCAYAPTGLLRGLYGCRVGRTFVRSFSPRGPCAPVWASLNRWPTSSYDGSAFCSRKFSFAACSGLQATPEPSGGSEPPGAAFPASRPHALSTTPHC